MKDLKLFFNTILVPLDYMVVLVSFLTAYAFREYLDEVFLIPPASFYRVILFLVILWPLTFATLGVYSFSLKKGSLEEFLKVVLGCSAAVTLASAEIYLTKQFSFSRLVLLTTWFLTIISTELVRLLVGLVQKLLYSRGKGLTRVLLVGEKEGLDFLREGIVAQGDPAMKIEGSVSTSREALGFIKEQKVDEIIQAFPDMNESTVVDLVNHCEEEGIRFKFVPNLLKPSLVNVATYSLAGVPVVELKATSLEGWTLVLKRLMDIVISALALVLLSPLFLLTAIAIRIDSPGTILFKHKRVGQNGKEFFLHKFRSMRMLMKNGMLVHAEKDAKIEKIKESTPSYKLEKDPRITRVGKLLRKTSIDELPQLWNVLRGEMSLIGPRAYLKKELETQWRRYPQAKGLISRLLSVKPGVTGIWQISGRSEVEFSERVAMDAYYASSASLLMDLKILLRTIPVVIKGRGAV